MRSLVTWLALFLGIGAGIVLGSPGVGSVVLPTVLAGVCLAWAAPAGRGHTVVFGISLALLGLARGASATASAELEADRRGLPPTTRSVHIHGASRPGPRCRVHARTARGSPVELSLPPGACPLAWGMEIRVPSPELHTDAVRVSPDVHDRVFVSRSWRRPGPERAWWGRWRASSSLALARARQAGWVASRGDPARGFVVASSLGLSAALPPSVRARLQRAGLGHLIAVSGLHVGLAALLWLTVLRWCLSSRWWGPRVALVVSFAPVVAYVVLTGAAAPAVRAAVMFGLVALGGVLGRPTHGPTVLLVAATLMAFVSPQWLTEPGFQLSVAAMVVLVGLPPGAGAAFTSWHLGWALLPLLWLHFDASSDGSVVANAVAMPVFALWVVPAAVIGWVALPVVGPAALDPAAAGAAVILDVAELVAGWPEIPRPIWVGVAVLACSPSVRARLSEPARAWLPHRGAALLLLVVAVASAWPTPVRPGWTAFSAGARPEVLVVTGQAEACVRAPSRGPAQWRARLEARGAAVVVGIALAPGQSVSDPAAHAWRRGLGIEGSGRGVPACSMPSDASVRAALDRCRAFSPEPAARRDPGGGLECWSARSGAWREPSIHSRGSVRS